MPIASDHGEDETHGEVEAIGDRGTRSLRSGQPRSCHGVQREQQRQYGRDRTSPMGMRLSYTPRMATAPNRSQLVFQVPSQRCRRRESHRRWHRGCWPIGEVEQIEEKQVRPGAWRGFSAKLTPFLLQTTHAGNAPATTMARAKGEESTGVGQHTEEVEHEVDAGPRISYFRPCPGCKCHPR